MFMIYALCYLGIGWGMLELSARYVYSIERKLIAHIREFEKQMVIRECKTAFEYWMLYALSFIFWPIVAPLMAIKAFNVFKRLK